MTRPLVTIAMPIYNVAPYVKSSLLSALNQTFDSLEIIVVDDKGQDNSMDIVRSVISTHPRGNIVRIIEHPRNLKTGAAKNSAIDNAKGKYLYFMDSDDIITDDCIHLFYSKISEVNADIAYGSMGMYKEENINTRIRSFTVSESKGIGEYSLLKQTHGLLGENYAIGMVNKMYDLDFLKKNQIRCIPHHLQEDAWFSFQVVAYANSFVSINKETYKYILHNTSQSHVVLGQFHKVQNHEICEAEKKLMRSYKCIPKGMLDLYCSRLKYLIPYMRGSNYTEEEKKEMTLDYTDISGIHFKYWDIYEWETLLLVLAYKTKSYDIIRHTHTFLNRIKNTF